MQHRQHASVMYRRRRPALDRGNPQTVVSGAVGSGHLVGAGAGEKGEAGDRRRAAGRSAHQDRKPWAGGSDRADDRRADGVLPTNAVDQRAVMRPRMTG
jgi:hypothetical protein